MKKIIFAISAATILTACDNREIEIARLNHQRDSLIDVSLKREGTVNEFISTFNEIESNLDSVAVKQHIIYVNSDKKGRELTLDQKARINNEISSINDLMKQNQEKIEELKGKLKRSINKNHHLETTVATLNEQLMRKNEELGVLNDKLLGLDAQVAQLHTTLDTLTAQNNHQSQRIAENTKTMHTAYYVIGKTKELKEAKLIDTKGGLLGIGKTPELKNDFDINKFTCIDYTQVSNIPVNSEGVKIITVHPTNSYTLDKDAANKNMVKQLVITDPEKFWSVSKYLVIAKN
jgi:peptidoglycan hydrolase CwlO-like protein